jgi:hypothetical protein
MVAYRGESEHAQCNLLIAHTEEPAMPDICHRVGTHAPLDRVHAALATPEGPAGWWTEETSGSAEVGGTLLLRFGDVGGFDLEVRASSYDETTAYVEWLVTDGPAEWVGTTITWRLERRGDWTIVLFAHRGWREEVEFLHHCSTKWATFLLSLLQLVETGTGRPAPHDLKVSDWH